MVGENNEDNKGAGQGASGSSTDKSDNANGTGAKGSATPTLEERVESLERENKGLKGDLRDERERRQEYARTSLSPQAFDNLEFSDEDKKKLEDSLEKDPVPTLVNLSRRVIHSEWNRFQEHNRCVSELMQRHPEMFDQKTGQYLPDSEKGKVWEAVVARRADLKGKPDAVRQCRYELEDRFKGSGVDSKKVDEARDEGAKKESERRDRVDGAHVDTGDGRKPTPAKGGKITSQESTQAAKHKMTDKEYAEHKDTRVIDADV